MTYTIHGLSKKFVSTNVSPLNIRDDIEYDVRRLVVENIEIRVGRNVWWNVGRNIKILFSTDKQLEDAYSIVSDVCNL